MNDRERHIDDAIDRVVRDMTALDPQPGVRHRVLRELDQPGAIWFSSPRLAAAATLVAIAVLVLLLARPTLDPVREHTVTSAPAVPGTPAVTGDVHEPDTHAPAPVAARRRRGGIPRGGIRFEEPTVVAAVELPEGGVEVEPLPAIDPIAIMPVRPAAIPDTPEIVIPPIELDPLDIGPLSPPR